MAAFIDDNGFSSDFYENLLDASIVGKFEPEWLLAMMCSESGLNPKAYNGNGGASGLSQLMPATLKDLGWFPGNEDYDSVKGIFRELAPEKQIHWTASYFEDWRRRYRIDHWQSRSQMYLVNFLPADLPGGTDPNRVLVTRDGLPSIYNPNRGLDHGNKGHITVGDLELAIAHATRCNARVYETALDSLDRVKRMREDTDPQGIGHEDDEMQASVEEDPVCRNS